MSARHPARLRLVAAWCGEIGLLTLHLAALAMGKGERLARRVTRLRMSDVALRLLGVGSRERKHCTQGDENRDDNKPNQDMRRYKRAMAGEGPRTDEDGDNTKE